MLSHYEVRFTRVDCPGCGEDIRRMDSAEAADSNYEHELPIDELSNVSIEVRVDGCPDMLLMIQAVKRWCRRKGVQMVCADCKEDMPFHPDLNACSTCIDSDKYPFGD